MTMDPARIVCGPRRRLSSQSTADGPLAISGSVMVTVAATGYLATPTSL
jgi:hypothetical protein